MKVKSSKITEIEYRELDGVGELDVTFTNGQVYRYYQVPKGIYERLMNAESIGRYHDQYIVKAGYRYKNVTSEVSTSELDRRIREAAKNINKLIDIAITERGYDFALHFRNEYFSEDMLVKTINDALFP